MTRAADHQGIGLDSNTLTYLVDAMTYGYEPKDDSDDKLRPERVGALRVFLYVAGLFVSPTAHREIEGISEDARRTYHDNIKDVLLEELVGLNSIQVKDRAKAFGLHHAGENDCLILAEVETAGLSHLLTLDDDMTAKLGSETQVEIVNASRFWRDLELPKGATLRIVPSNDNPLSANDWWRW